MRLSKIIKEPNIDSITIDIKEDVTCKIFFNNNRFRVRTKKYKSLDIDVPVIESTTYGISHLGIKRYRIYNDIKGKFYVNIYNY